MTRLRMEQCEPTYEGAFLKTVVLGAPAPRGWLNRFRIGLVDYEQVVYLADYDR
jgi:hypothetical protein